MRRIGSALLVTVLLVAGCGDEAAAPADPEQEPTVTQSQDPSKPPTTPTPSSPAPSSPAPSGDARGTAVADLAGRLKVEPGAITVVSDEQVTWRDGSLGCPQPGMMYPQMLTPGGRIVLEAGGKRYEYHSSGQRAPFLCENPQPPLPPG